MHSLYIPYMYIYIPYIFPIYSHVFLLIYIYVYTPNLPLSAKACVATLGACSISIAILSGERDVGEKRMLSSIIEVPSR